MSHRYCTNILPSLYFYRPIDGCALNSIYSGCQKNVPLFEGFFLQPLIPPFRISECIFEKRYKPLSYNDEIETQVEFISAKPAAEHQIALAHDGSHIETVRDSGLYNMAALAAGGAIQAATNRILPFIRWKMIDPLRPKIV